MARSGNTKWLIAGGTVIVMLLLLELTLRLAGLPREPETPRFIQSTEWNHRDIIARDHELFWRYRPNQAISGDFLAHGVYTINSHGFRGPEFTQEKSKGTIRVICLGGSTTFGLGVTDGEEYPRQLEGLLRHLDPEKRRWEVINAGVTNYSTHQGLVLARRVLAEWDPDIVLFNFAWGDLQPAGRGIPDNEIVLPPQWQLDLEHTLRWSALCRFVLHLFSNDPSRARATPSHIVWRVNATSFVANVEKLVRTAADAGARPIWVTSPIAWPPEGQSDTTGIFHYHHQYHRAARYGATLGGGEIAELANNFNRFRNLFDEATQDIEHFTAAGHNFAGDYLARFILGLPLEKTAPSRLPRQNSAEQEKTPAE